MVGEVVSGVAEDVQAVVQCRGLVMVAQQPGIDLPALQCLKPVDGRPDRPHLVVAAFEPVAAQHLVHHERVARIRRVNPDRPAA